MVCLIVCIIISAALFSSLVLFVVVVAAALFVFGGLHFHLPLGFMHAYFNLFVLSLRRDLNKNSSNPCSFLRQVLVREDAS